VVQIAYFSDDDDDAFHKSLSPDEILKFG
jgi:hypothetical protein